MKNKVVKNYIYDGLGFPILLPAVEMIYFEGEWHPKIDVYGISEKAMNALITQESRFTGNQVKFVRAYFSMSLRDFAKNVVHESHTAVNKWEQCRDKATNMDGNIEAMLRLYMCEHMFTKTTKLIKKQNDFYKKYQKIKKLFSVNRAQLVRLTLTA